MTIGVYSLVNTIDGKRYVGSSVQIKTRLYKHNYHLRKGNHHCKHLQNAFNLYGEDAFTTETVLLCDKVNLEYYEQVVMDYFRTETGLYNMQPEAYTPRNSRLSQEHKDNISKGLKGRPKTKEHNEAVSKALSGRKGHRTPKTEEQKAKIRQSVKESWSKLSTEERAARGASAQAGRERAVELTERMRTQQISAAHAKN